MDNKDILARLRARAAELDAKERGKSTKGTKASVGMNRREEEHRLQCQCVAWFRDTYPALSMLFFAVPNGGAIGQSKSKAEHEKAGAKRKAEGVLAGVSDLILLVSCGGYHGLCIEMKTSERGSVQSRSQKTFEKAVTLQGYKYIVPRTLEEFQWEVMSYLKKDEDKLVRAC